jgi:hypothetical protein
MTHPRMMEIADVCRRHWLLTVILLAAAVGLGMSLVAVLCAYSRSDYDYLTGAPALSSTKGLA